MRNFASSAVCLIVALPPHPVLHAQWIKNIYLCASREYCRFRFPFFTRHARKRGVICEKSYFRLNEITSDSEFDGSTRFNERDHANSLDLHLPSSPLTFSPSPPTVLRSSATICCPSLFTHDVTTRLDAKMKCTTHGRSCVSRS